MEASQTWAGACSLSTLGGENVNYEYNGWQEFVAACVRLLSRSGYKSFSLSNYPLSKKMKWREIDIKLMKKYQASGGSMRRYRAKLKGYCTFFFIRWHNVAVIFRSAGELPPGIVLDDTFYSIAKHPLKIQISEDVHLEIVQSDVSGRITAKLSEETYRNIKAKLYWAAKYAKSSNNKANLLKAFDKMNGFPAFKGICQQKSRLKRYCIVLAKRHGMEITDKDFRFVISRNKKKKPEGNQDS